ncbi:LysE family translocator [Motilimonas eburnea]|uniref:LysE family translocator n=1 Tax=Motilimonas eburnea TaxID=1737488 RepID=UPI001E493611|nr:LysE family translocator [Motilimonas eburnea]MCE2570887.1 LysE family translocator [Motilimonas eburnea]
MIVNFEAFIIAITLLTLTPGLDTALVIRNTSKGTGLSGYVTSLGICCGLFVHALCSAIGISAILAQSAYWFNVIKWAGALYLIWLGLSSLVSILKNRGRRAAITPPIDSASSLPKLTHQPRQYFQQGFISNVLNPKTAIFYLAFLPQFINPDYSPLWQSFILAGIHFVIAMVWQCAIAASLETSKKWFNQGGFSTWMEGVTGTILIALGTMLLVDNSPT